MKFNLERLPPKPPLLWPGWWLDFGLTIGGFVLAGYMAFVLHLDAKAGNYFALFVASLFAPWYLRCCYRDVKRLMLHERQWRELREAWEVLRELHEERDRQHARLEKEKDDE